MSAFNVNIPKFLTQNIQDPEVRNNFDLLNRYLMQSQSTSSANLVRGAVDLLQVSISTVSSNPVALAIEAAPTVQQGVVNPSFFQISNTGVLTSLTQAVIVQFQRKNLAGLYTTVASIEISSFIRLNTADVENLLAKVPLPFGCTDDNNGKGLPAGQYFYQAQILSVSGTAVSWNNVQLTARELH